MDTLAIIGLVGNIVQFVNFSSKLITKLTELYQSSEGVLVENIDVKTVTNYLVLLNNKLKDAATTSSNNALKRLYKLYKFTTNKLLTVLNKVKLNGK